jgi:hypothetical protein
LLGLKGDLLAYFQRVKYLDDNLAAEAVRLPPKGVTEVRDRGDRGDTF